MPLVPAAASFVNAWTERCAPSDFCTIDNVWLFGRARFEWCSRGFLPNVLGRHNIRAVVVEEVQKCPAIGKRGAKVADRKVVHRANRLAPLQQQAETLRVTVRQLAVFAGPHGGVLVSRICLELGDLCRELGCIKQGVDLKVHHHLPEKLQGLFAVALHDGRRVDPRDALDRLQAVERSGYVLHLCWDGGRGDTQTVNDTVLARENLDQFCKFDAVIQVDTDVLDFEVVVVQLRLLMLDVVPEMSQVLAEIAFALEDLARKVQENGARLFELGVGIEQARVAVLDLGSFGNVEEQDDAQELLHQVHFDSLLEPCSIHAGDGGVLVFRLDTRAAKQLLGHEIREERLLQPREDAQRLAVHGF